MIKSTTSNQQPGLYGLRKSNRDFTKPDSWGKNIFNNAFPAALACYMYSKDLQPVYLSLDANGGLSKGNISIETLFGIEPTDPNTFFSFESDFVPYQPLVFDNLPRADLVIMNSASGVCLSDIEIKLTALPDNSTYTLPEERYGSEIVVRTDTIVYMALSIANQFKSKRDELTTFFQKLPQIGDWTDIADVSPHIPAMADILNRLMVHTATLQRPLVIQPIWKTQRKQLTLHQDAFDIFVWSNYAFSRLFIRDTNLNGKTSRGARSIVWLTKMLFDFAKVGRFNHEDTIDHITFNTKNDKAFAVNGAVTQPLMESAELLRPRIKREEIRAIVLGGGEKYLSPERRLDAAIVNTPGLFD